MGSPFGNIEVHGERENNLMSYKWAAYGLESHLDSHPFEHGDPPAHGAVGLPAGSAGGLPGRQLRVAGVLCGVEQVLARID